MADFFLMMMINLGNVDIHEQLNGSFSYPDSNFSGTNSIENHSKKMGVTALKIMPILIIIFIFMIIAKFGTSTTMIRKTESLTKMENSAIGTFLASWGLLHSRCSLGIIVIVCRPATGISFCLTWWPLSTFMEIASQNQKISLPSECLVVRWS